MFCTSCGTQLPPGAAACPSCGARAISPAAVSAPAINNYLVPAILTTFCCCLPFGIVAIVYAAQVNSKLAAGDIAGAQLSAKNAKMWSWIAAICGLLGGLAYAGFVGLATVGSHGMR
jgi:Interferon-induced transmembrane protein/zinc-ribbon domain